jgi:hypothetical protein
MSLAELALIESAEIGLDLEQFLRLVERHMSFLFTAKAQRARRKAIYNN